MREWRSHDGGPNPAPGQSVDLYWGVGVIEGQPSNKVNWRIRWLWRPAARSSSTPSGGGDE